MISVDTNVLLRYLLEPVDAQNPVWQTQAARQLIDGADDVFVADLSVGEKKCEFNSLI